MFYKALGYIVWQNRSFFFGRTTPRQTQLTGGGAALAGIVVGALLALLLSKRESE
jgi:membrane associated rhomboid family serine protease